jgi:multimeric flavodoxin WrbA
VNDVAKKLEECDGLVVGTPVYFGSANATLISFLTRLFYSTSVDKTMKVGASVEVFHQLMIKLINSLRFLVCQ